MRQPKFQLLWTIAVSICHILLLCSSCQAQPLRYNSYKGLHVQQEPRTLSESTEWSYEFVKRGAVGFNLTLIVKDDYLDESKIQAYDTQVFQSFKVFDDLLDDRTAVAKHDDVCYMAVRGQERHLPFDIWQTLSPFVKHNAFDSGCSVRRSFYYAYKARFADKMFAAIDDCVSTCGDDGPCPLVLNGHSTGGASVTIAALDPRMKQYNPTIYAFGPIRGVVSEECEDEDLANIYRIVAANTGYYDKASDSAGILGGRHHGKFFIMDEMSDFYYIGPVDGVAAREPNSYNIHGLEVYSNRIQALARRPQSEFPLTLSQFPDGHWCGYNDECQSGLCVSSAALPSAKFCASGENSGTVLNLEGAPCAEGSECTSGICKFEKCALPSGKMAEGSPCVNHFDCDTEKCSGGACISKFFSGSFCYEDWECEGTCTGPMSFVAMFMRRCEDPGE